MRLLPIALVLAGCAKAPAVPVFHTAGGDAWTFEKVVTGEAPASCAAVLVESPRGRVTADREGETFRARVPLAAGENAVSALCVDDRGRESASEPQQWQVRLADRPTARVRIGDTEEGAIRLDAGGSTVSEARTTPLVAWDWAPVQGNPAALAAESWTGEQITLDLPAVDGAYHVDLTVTDADGATDTSRAVFRVEEGALQMVDLDREHPDWVEGALVYGVVPFFFGEGLDDVTARLDHLDAVGADILYLSPIMGSPDDDFGYAVTDYFGVRERFGTEEDLRELVSAAHARGMRVILDFVPNHTSDRHPYFVSAETDSASPYASFYARDADGEPTHYFDWANLPNLDYDQEEVRRYVTEAAAYWVREIGVDGFRVDAAWGPAQRAPDFWLDWRRELKRIDPDLLLLAEASAREPYWFDHGFDAAYDWTWELGEWAWEDAFEEGSVRGLADALTVDGEGHPDDALVFRFLDNNDTGARFVDRHGPARTEVATAMLLTLPGLPMLYTGQEIGASYLPYDEGPVLDWEADPHDLLGVHQRLVDLRDAIPELRSGDLALADTGSDVVLGYWRGDRVLVLLNFSDAPVDARVPGLPQSDGVLFDHVGGEALEVEGDTWTVPLPANGYRVLEP